MRSQHELIVVIAEHGFAADVMDAARGAGARGGTVVRGRSLAAEDALKLLLFTIQPENDVVLILVPAAGRQPVMKAICAPFSALNLPVTSLPLAHKVTAAAPITRSAAFVTPVISPTKRLREAAI